MLCTLSLYFEDRFNFVKKEKEFLIANRSPFLNEISVNSIINETLKETLKLNSMVSTCFTPLWVAFVSAILGDPHVIRALITLARPLTRFYLKLLLLS